MLLICQMCGSHGGDVCGVMPFSLVEMSGVLVEHNVPQFSVVWKMAF